MSEPLSATQEPHRRRMVRALRFIAFLIVINCIGIGLLVMVSHLLGPVIGIMLSPLATL